MSQFYKIKESSKINTKYIEFYRQLKEKDVISKMHQLFTYAFLVGLKENKRNPDPRTDDICNVFHVDDINFEIIKGIALKKLNYVKNGDELLKEIEAYADGGIEIIMKDWENDKTIRLDKYL